MEPLLVEFVPPLGAELGQAVEQEGPEPQDPLPEYCPARHRLYDAYCLMQEAPGSEHFAAAWSYKLAAC